MKILPSFSGLLANAAVTEQGSGLRADPAAGAGFRGPAGRRGRCFQLVNFQLTSPLDGLRGGFEGALAAVRPAGFPAGGEVVSGR